jgi:hypothetical protein
MSITSSTKAKSESPPVFSYYIDRHIFLSLSELIVQAFDHLSGLLSESFFKVSELSDLKFESQIQGSRNRSIILCLSNEFTLYEKLLEVACPPRILTPLWVLSSALCRRLLPTVIILWMTTV